MPTAQLIQLKTRHSGAAGAPTSLKPGEPAFNAADGTLYIGVGDDGAGNADSIIAIASAALLVSAVTQAYVDDAVAQINSVPTVGAGLTLLANNSIGLAESVDLQGAPTAPTPAVGDDSQKISTTAYVLAENRRLYNQIVDASPAEHDTIKEVFAFAQGNTDAVELLQQAIVDKIAKGQNLNDLADKAAARTNLGLGNLAEQAADSIDITGGTIGADVVFQGTVYGGTF